MISGSEWLLEVSRTILPDPQEAIGKTTASLAMIDMSANNLDDVLVALINLDLSRDHDWQLVGDIEKSAIEIGKIVDEIVK